jgi:hypothetical protein
MSAHPILDGDARKLPEPMSEAELEDFLTEAIGLYAEHTRTELRALRTFEEARLLLKNRGLVLAIGRAEFRISITRTA